MSASQQQYQQQGPGAGASQPTSMAGDPPPSVQGALGLWDAVSIIVGIVVGAGIYQTAPTILFMSGSPQVALIAWGIGGLLSFIGALCYAELATTYPRDGGDIVYLNRAFGRWVGFLFGWVQLTVILTGSIGAMAFVFANYAIRLCKDGFAMELGFYSAFAFAGGAIFLLTLTNILGVVLGKIVQNVLTLAKVIGLGAIIAAGFMAPSPGAFEQHNEPFTAFPPLIGIALVLILYTYGGWNDAAFVAAEVKNGKKNITRSLVLGIFIITALYMLVNYAYINALGFSKAQGSGQIAADVLALGAGKIDPSYSKYGVTLMCVLVMVSALGAVNGLIFTGARVYATVGKDYTLLSWMGGWSYRQGTPIPALITQGVLALGLVFLVGTDEGRQSLNWLLEKTATRTDVKSVKGEDGREHQAQVPAGHVLPPIKWDGTEDEKVSKAENVTNLAKGGFETLVTCTAPIFWVFFLLTGISLFVLRERDRTIERPFKVPFYPELPLIFCLSCGYMLYSSVDYAFSKQWKGGVFLLGVFPLLVGLVLYRVSRLLERRPDEAS